MLIVVIAAILLLPCHVLSTRPTCVSIKEGEEKTRVIASCTFMNLADIPKDLPVDSVLGLDVSNNQLKDLHNESFTRYINLRTLTLSYNEINHVRQNAFSGLHQLREVDLSYNQLTYVHPETFSDIPKLESVSLEGNPIVDFPVDSPVLISSSLTSLDLSSCSLTSVHLVTFSRLPKLIHLDLSSNYMQGIHRDSLETLKNLRVVDLSKNRWKCSCDVREVMQWTSSLRARPYLQRPIKCIDKGHYRTLWSQAKGGQPCNDMPALRGNLAVASDEDALWYRVPVRPYSKSNFVLAFMILPCVLSICVLLSLVAIKCMDRRRAEDKLPLYKHVDG